MNIACMLWNLQKRTSFCYTKKRDIFAYFKCFNNFFTSRFKTQTFWKIFIFWKNDRFIILNVKYFWYSTIFANTKSNNLQKFCSSFSSFSSFSFQIFVRFYDYRVRYELNAFTNKSSKSRILLIDKKKKSQLIVSKRNWKKNEK